MSDDHASISKFDSTVKPATHGVEHHAPHHSHRLFSSPIASAVKILVVGVIIGVLIYFYQRGDLTQENLRAVVTALPTSLFLPAYFLLPLVGFPISVMLFASGMKYGFGLAILIAVIGMGSHTYAAWHLAHSLFRHRLERWLNNTRFDMPTIPEDHQVWFTSLFVTIPGLPYALKLYSLAMTNLPFRRYLPIVWLIHVLNSIPLIGIGMAAIHIDAKWLVVFGVLAVLTVLGTHWLKKHYADVLEESGNPDADSH